MKNLMMAAAVITTCGVAFAAEDTCGDGMCPRPASPAEAEFAVLSPVPETAVETVRQMYRNCVLVLDASDYVETEISVKK